MHIVKPSGPYRYLDPLGGSGSDGFRSRIRRAQQEV